MDFIELSPKTLNVSTKELGFPTLRVQGNGVIYFNKKAVELLGKNLEKRVIVLQDKVHQKDFYLHFSDEGFAIKPYKKNEGTFYFQTQKLANIMREAIKPPKKAFGIKILEKQVQDAISVYPLLTSKTI